ncbi:MAG: type I glyceraldehyde-3-phosphate dehydrogenase [Oceanospirillales bacterium TMED33]|nr:type I glyceraldehyde-3-phosphate dehydrogenase [Gammaproteobacteria bacterium]RPG21507.1 MAG: type I glyceraldehyde-3-phosphate dehydrogenase [Oceanospirillales bacterium TMED33]CAI8266636.1 MAG: D-erythrose-4-phosphate dehydrogenase [Gammaproteobacteria bacterium]
MIRVAINGFGRIGRNILRALYERNLQNEIQIVAINDLGSPEINAHLLQFDTTHGRFAFSVEHIDNGLKVEGQCIEILAIRNPAELPWERLEVDVVYECTGLFTSKEDGLAHIHAGAKKVIISAPGNEVDATIVYGVNDQILNDQMQVISNASCTTNCLAPLAKALDDAFGLEDGQITTIHAFTNDQKLTDVYHSDLYRARAAGHSMIPTKTGAAAAVGLVLPHLNGRLDGMAVRVPTINVSLVDLTCRLKTQASASEVNQALLTAAAESANGILTVNTLPLVSQDFNHNPASSIVDLTHTKVLGGLTKVLSWYDNEWGFSNRMLDTTLSWMVCSDSASGQSAA